MNYRYSQINFHINCNISKLSRHCFLSLHFRYQKQRNLSFYLTTSVLQMLYFMQIPSKWLDHQNWESYSSSNSCYFSLIFQFERDFFATFFFSRENHKGHPFEIGRLLQYSISWVQYWLRQLEVSHTYKQDVWLCFWIKTFFSKYLHHGGASNERVVYLILRIPVYFSIELCKLL